MQVNLDLDLFAEELDALSTYNLQTRDAYIERILLGHIREFCIGKLPRAES